MVRHARSRCGRGNICEDEQAHQLAEEVCFLLLKTILSISLPFSNSIEVTVSTKFGLGRLLALSDFASPSLRSSRRHRRLFGSQPSITPNTQGKFSDLRSRTKYLKPRWGLNESDPTRPSPLPPYPRYLPSTATPQAAPLPLFLSSSGYEMLI